MARAWYFLIKTSGSKLWRFIYRFNGKQNRLSFGSYPDTSLENARRQADDVRDKLANGIDPSGVRKQAKAEKQQAADNQKRLDAGLPIINSFELYVFPVIGGKAICEIKSPDVFSIIKPLIAKNQLEIAHRVHAEISAAYAVAHGFTDYDLAQAVGAQIPAQKVKHNAAITEPKEVGQLLRDIAHYQGTYVVQCALKLSPYLFQRPGEIRQMEWKDIALEAREWRYFVTKTEVQHIVPLSNQAIAVLEAIKPLTDSGRYVFPSSRSDGRPMSDGTVRTALKTLGYDSDVMSTHGFRTTASTLLNEQGWGPDAIERQLAHSPRDQVRAAYNRAQYLEERRRMMQAWADFLDSLKAGAQVIPFQRQA